MASLAAINKTLIEQNKLVKISIDGTATEKAKQAEERAERKTYDSEVLGTLKSIHSALGGGGGGGLAGADKKTGGWMAGLMSGLGGLAKGIFKTISSIGMGFVKGMGSLALGIGAFMLGLGGAGKIAELAGFDGDGLRNLVGNTFGAFRGMDLVAMAAVIAAAMLLDKAGTSKKGVILGMGAIGAGVSAFILTLGGAGAIAELAGFDGKMLNTLITNVFGAFSGTDLVIMGSILGAAIGLEKFKITKKGVILGMGAIGAGVAAFILGILAAEGFASLGALVALDGTNLSTLMTNVFGAFGGIDAKALGALLIGGVVVGKVQGGAKAVMKGMLAIGGGVAAFTLGILAAEGFSKLGDLIGLDGGSLNTLLSNFLASFKGVSIEAMGVMLTAAGVVGAFGAAGAKAAVIGMGAIGAGVAAFTIGLLVGEGAAKLGSMLGLDGSSLATLLTNLGKGIGGFVGGIGKGMFKQLEDLDAERLKELGKGIAGIGIGIAAFAAAKIVGGIGSVVDGLTSFFGGDSPIDTIIALSKDKDINAKRLAELGEAIGPLGEGIASFGGFELSSGMFSGESDLEKFIDAIAKIGKKEVVINKDKMQDLADGITPLATAMKGFSGVDVGKVVGYRRTGKNDIDVFFESLSGKNVSQVADKATMEAAAGGIGPLATAMASFGNLDLDKITGGLGEDNLTKFFVGIGKATDKIKKPEALKAISLGISDLAKGLKSFANINSDSLVKNMDSLDKLAGMNLRNPEILATVLAQGQQVQESRTMDFAEKSAMNVSGGTVVVNNDNSVINNDNRNSTVNQTSVAAKMQVESKKEG